MDPLNYHYATVLGILISLLLGVAACGQDGGAKDAGSPGTMSFFEVPRYPVDLAVGAHDTIWVACREGRAVVEVLPTGEIRATHAMEAKPMAIAIDGNGIVWVPLSNGDIVRLDPATGEMTAPGHVDAPSAIALDSKGALWIGTNNGAQKLGKDGAVLASVTIGGKPLGMAVGPDDTLWILTHVMDQTTGKGKDVIVKVVPDGTIASTIPNPTRAWDLAINAQGNLVLYDVHGPKLTILDPEGKVVVERRLGSENGAGSMPRGIAIAKDGVIWTVDSATTQATAADLSSVLDRFKNGDTKNGIAMVPKAIAIDSKGNVWLAIANDWSSTDNVEENTRLVKIAGVAQGPQFFPVKGPMWP